ncbi:MAG: tetratricopeptide repeat protein [Planctomycetes bacterium]|nr:tetratricopeptide repeat protein [Planctomycetota bacterium]
MAPQGPADRSGRISSIPAWRVPAAGAAIALAAIICYSNTFSCPFVFDDVPSIVQNRSIRDLGNVRDVFHPPAHTSVGGRPVANLTLAVNYAAGGLDVWDYHALNLAVHLLAALTLFGLVRRLLLRPVVPEYLRAVSAGLAFAAALLWAVHPLATQAVTYIVQRCESLMALFYLLTLYCFCRSLDSGRPGLWLAMSVACCAAGMGCKEVMATAPLVVLACDWLFYSGSIRKALAGRRIFYAALACTWGFIIWGMMQSGMRGSDNMLSGKSITWGGYAMTQPEVLLHYLGLSVWPAGLCFDYFWPIQTDPWRIALASAGLIALAALTCRAIFRGSPLGFAGFFFFAVLSVTSGILPVSEIAFEYRMYLPLAAITSLAAIGGFAATRWIVGKFAAGRTNAADDSGRDRITAGACLAILAGLAIVLSALTIQRNGVYRSAESLWADTLAKSPHNPRAMVGCGRALMEKGDIAAAIAQFDQAIKEYPLFVQPHNHRGAAWGMMGRYEQALADIETAIRLQPGYRDAYFNRAVCMERMGRIDQAIADVKTFSDMGGEPDSRFVEKLKLASGKSPSTSPASQGRK